MGEKIVEEDLLLLSSWIIEKVGLKSFYKRPNLAKFPNLSNCEEINTHVQLLVFATVYA